MKRKNFCVSAVSLILAGSLAACSNSASGQGGDVEPKEDAVEMQTSEDEAETESPEDAEPAQEYRANMTSVSDGTETNADYETDDMLPRPSDDTFIMSVEDAMKFMNGN